LDPLPNLPEGARLSITAGAYSILEQPVPPQGKIAIGLISRRRSLLAHLVSWAERMGVPWNQGVQTTPAAVAKVALRQGDARAKDWALAVEAAAYGPGEPDALGETTLLGQTPPLDRTRQ
jgi:hypothetical protein